jgi:hypothetical protein
MSDVIIRCAPTAATWIRRAPPHLKVDLMVFAIFLRKRGKAWYSKLKNNGERKEFACSRGGYLLLELYHQPPNIYTLWSVVHRRRA